jgi:hypothetical protein
VGLPAEDREAIRPAARAPRPGRAPAPRAAAARRNFDWRPFGLGRGRRGGHLFGSLGGLLFRLRPGRCRLRRGLRDLGRRRRLDHRRRLWDVRGGFRNCVRIRLRRSGGRRRRLGRRSGVPRERFQRFEVQWRKRRVLGRRFHHLLLAEGEDLLDETERHIPVRQAARAATGRAMSRSQLCPEISTGTTSPGAPRSSETRVKPSVRPRPSRSTSTA